MPPAVHPHYVSVLRELVCVDLDYGWGRGEPTPLDEYRRRFPALFADPETARAIVWEDYRQRRQAGQEPDPEDYRRRFGVNPIDGQDAGSTDGASGPSVAHSDSPPTSVVIVKPSTGGDWAARLDELGTGAVPGAADLYRAVRQSDPAAADRYARAIAALPRVGQSFAGFRLEAELGR